MAREDRDGDHPSEADRPVPRPITEGVARELAVDAVAVARGEVSDLCFHRRYLADDESQ